jgi:hypothetical protein
MDTVYASTNIIDLCYISVDSFFWFLSVELWAFYFASDSCSFSGIFSPLFLKSAPIFFSFLFSRTVRFLSQSKPQLASVRGCAGACEVLGVPLRHVRRWGWGPQSSTSVPLSRGGCVGLGRCAAARPVPRRAVGVARSSPPLHLLRRPQRSCCCCWLKELWLTFVSFLFLYFFALIWGAIAVVRVSFPWAPILVFKGDVGATVGGGFGELLQLCVFPFLGRRYLCSRAVWVPQ